MQLHEEYILHEQLRNLLDGFTDLLGIRIAVFTPEMREIRAGLKKESCEYCRLLRNRFGMDSKCKTIDRKMFEKAMARGKAIVYKCHGCLTEAIFPLMNEGEIFGFLMIGQFRSVGQQSRLLKTLSPEQKNKLKNAYEKTPLFNSQQLKHILVICQAVVELIVSKGLMSNRQWKTILPVVDHMRRHPEKQLSLEQAAELAGVSKSSVSHLFRKITGCGFKQYQIELMLKAAEALMRRDPEKTVMQISNDMGYEDQFYFSRMFKKYRGISPSEAKKSLVNTAGRHG